MKICIIPDIHGSHEWEKAKEIQADYYVFLGDIVDSWNNAWPDQGENIAAFAAWVREDPEHRIWLLGNHDWSYLSQSRNGGNCSGHQSGKAGEIRSLLLANKDLIKLAWECDGWVFSHAGFTNHAIGYMKKVMHNLFEVHPKAEKNHFDSQEEYKAYMDELYKDFKEWDESEYSIDLLNKTFAERMAEYPENTHKWLAFDEKLDWDGCFSGSGDEVSQFCLWVRPHSLLEDAAYPKQVVGHTEYCFWNKPEVLTKGENIAILMDSRDHHIMMFDTQDVPKGRTELDFNRAIKQLDKQICNLKSVFGMFTMGDDTLSDEEKHAKVLEEFPENGEFIWKSFFKSEEW